MTTAYRRPKQFMDGFEEVRLLGSGHFSSVYLARNKRQDQRAVKFFNLDDTSELNEERWQEMIRREMTILWSLRGCDYVVKLLAGSVERGELHMVRHECSLLDRMGEIKRQPRLIGVVIEQMLRALIYIHAQGLVHGDVKVENILCNRDLTHCCLTDFGCAGEERDRVESIVGSYMVMAPELRLHRKFKTIGDMFSLGISTLEMKGMVPNTDLSVRDPHRWYSEVKEVRKKCPESWLRHILRGDPERRADAKKTHDELIKTSQGQPPEPRRRRKKRTADRGKK